MKARDNTITINKILGLIDLPKQLPEEQSDKKITPEE